MSYVLILLTIFFSLLLGMTKEINRRVSVQDKFWKTKISQCIGNTFNNETGCDVLLYLMILFSQTTKNIVFQSVPYKNIAEAHKIIPMWNLWKNVQAHRQNRLNFTLAKSKNVTFVARNHLIIIRNPERREVKKGSKFGFNPKCDLTIQNDPNLNSNSC